MVKYAETIDKPAPCMRPESAARIERVDKIETHAMRLYINIDNRKSCRMPN